jgi:fructose-1,6-bisphosphatase/sedoheptulose 1,7-bisphosphatase-like protein
MHSVRRGRGSPGTGVIAAAALKCMGGHLQGRLHPRNDEERKRAIAAGYDLDAILHTNDLAKGDQVDVPGCTMPAAQLLPCLPQRLCTAPQQHTHRGRLC